MVAEESYRGWLVRSRRFHGWLVVITNGARGQFTPCCRAQYSQVRVVEGDEIWVSPEADGDEPHEGFVGCVRESDRGVEIRIAQSDATMKFLRGVWEYDGSAIGMAVEVEKSGLGIIIRRPGAR